MDKLLTSKKVIVCVGSGGVGKTTMSATMGVRAAQLGLRVLVLTIDPAKRLATSLGIQQNGGEPIRVPDQSFKGELWAAVINAKSIFDKFVRQSIGKSEDAERILNNRLYQQLSTQLSGSQEFTALEQLYEFVRSGRYDLVILDTPPAQHAIDFLNAPQRLYQVFDDRVVKWFARTSKDGGGLFGILQKATSQVLKLLQNITGNEFIEELGEFFKSISGLREVLQSHTSEVHKLLTGPDTEFVLVTGFDEAKIKEAIHLQKELKRGGYSLASIIINRAFPEWMPDEQVQPKVGDSVEMANLISFYGQLKEFYKGRQHIYNELERKVAGSASMLRIPDFDQDVYSLKSLTKLAEFLAKASV